MAQLSIFQALTIFAWFPLAFTLAVLLLIARFYERFSGTHMYWRLYTLPILGYAAAHVREAAVGMPGDDFAEIAQAVSGVILFVLMARLSMYMLRPRRDAVTSSMPPLLTATGVLGDLALGFALVMFGRYTRRMVRLNRQPAYHRTYYVAALGMWTAGFARLLFHDGASATILLYPVLVAASMTLAAVISWRSWSWLLAERA